MLIHFAQLNSGSGVHSNSFLSQEIPFMFACLDTCPLNYAFDPFYDSSSLKDLRDVVLENQFNSGTCLSCSSVFPLFNSILLKSSLSSLTFDDFEKPFSPQKSNLKYFFNYKQLMIFLNLRVRY
jgi:hypothetical protein